MEEAYEKNSAHGRDYSDFCACVFLLYSSGAESALTGFYSWLLEVAVVYMVASLIGTFSISDLRNRTVDFKFLKNNAKAGLIVVILSLAVLGSDRSYPISFFMPALIRS